MLNDFVVHDNQWHDQKMMKLKTSTMSTTGWSSARVYRKSFFTPLDLFTDVNPTNRSLWHKTTHFDFLGMSANEQASYQSSLSFVFENYWHFLGFHIFSFCSHSVFWPTLLSVWIKFPNLVVFAPEVRLNGGTIVVLAERQMGLWAGWSSVCLLQSLLLQWIVCTG